MSEPHDPNAARAPGAFPDKVYTLMACTNCQRGYRVRDMYETEEGLVCEECCRGKRRCLRCGCVISERNTLYCDRKCYQAHRKSGQR